MGSKAQSGEVITFFENDNQFYKIIYMINRRKFNGRINKTG